MSTTVHQPPATVWRALTEPQGLAMWLGRVDPPMAPGVATRIDFGDGDFFDVEVDLVRAYDRLSFRWRFLGVGPEAQITWTVTGDDRSSTFTVDDRCPGRPPSEVAQLKEGWRDFTERLTAYLTTGAQSRYRWRQVIDGSAHLPPTRWRPLREDGVFEWLPIGTDGDRQGWFFVVDNDGPRRFAITDWSMVPDRTLTFSVAIPQARALTTCEVRLTPHDGGTHLRVQHEGWGRLGLTDLHSRGLRHRFAATWAAALSLAEQTAHTRQGSR
ncbi:SRPBCC family protein [Micromonospora sp. WMMA1923]|uniref:SRPBCC family protein n=1 Tax=Micromonospora sp. WMMA1923 TaxID=3404125 RepID=UPI003B92BA1D